jgi:hypothetical protein
VRFLAVAAYLSLAACGIDSDFGGTQFDCNAEEPCPPGFECINGTCESQAPTFDSGGGGGDDGAPAADGPISTSDGGAADAVVVPIDGSLGISIIVDPDPVSLMEGPTRTIDISLSAAPGGSVDVMAVSSDPGAATVEAGPFTFTDATFGTPQTIDVRGVPDGNAMNEVLTFTFTGPGLDTTIVDVTVADAD